MNTGPGMLCKVCGDRASGKHYGVVSCDGCRGFFKRSIRRNLEYVCKEQGRCVVDLSRRNQCQSCRFTKCLNVNMRREAVQHERAPRSCPPVSAFGMDFCRSSAATPFGPGSFFMPLPLHFQAHSAAAAAAVAGSPPSAPMHTYFSSLPVSQYLDSPRISLLSERLFGRALLSPIQSSEELKESLALVKEDEVTSSEATESTISDSMARNSMRVGITAEFHSKDAIFESAAKLLFMAVKWAKSIPSFSSLPLDDRTILIRESWADLFVLTCAQWNFVDSNFPIELDGMSKLQNALNMYSVSRIDLTEAACLKAAVLFRPERTGLLARHQIACLQDQTLCLLNEKSGAVRMGHLLLLLPVIRQAADPTSLQDVFFKRTLGEVAVERIIEDLLKT